MKDYYRVLGILSCSDAVVVDAAYRALVEAGKLDLSETGKNKLAEVAEAYEVLRQETTRSSFDAQAARSCEIDESELLQEEDGLVKCIEPDWECASGYFPDLIDIVARLSRISRRLANTYQLHLLASKQFEERHEIGARMEAFFLRKHFGENGPIIKFSRALVAGGYRAALLELSKAVRLLGSRVDPAVIINKISVDWVCALMRNQGYSAVEYENAKANWTRFKRYISEGSLSEVFMLGIQCPALMDLSDEDSGNTALHIAVIEKKPECVRAILKMGANPVKKNNMGITALDFANDGKHVNELIVLKTVQEEGLQ